MLDFCCLARLVAAIACNSLNRSELSSIADELSCARAGEADRMPYSIWLAEIPDLSKADPTESVDILL